MTPDLLTPMAVFVRVAELESFTGAAGDLGLSKSAVSKQIARLEDHLGTRLINRTTRRLSLTEAGLAFYQRASQALEQADAAEAAVGHLAETPRGRLKVNAPMSFGVGQVAPLLPLFMARYPELEVDLVLNDRLVDLVEEGFDVGVRIGALQDSSLVARRLAPARRILAAAPDYLVRKGRPAHPEDIKDHDCLLYIYQPGGPKWRFRRDDGEEVDAQLRGRLSANNGDALLEAAIGGLGLLMTPTFIACDALASGRLVEVLADWRILPEISVHAVFPASRNLSPKVRAFVDFLAEAYGPEPPWDRRSAGAGGA